MGGYNSQQAHENKRSATPMLELEERGVKVGKPKSDKSFTEIGNFQMLTNIQSNFIKDFQVSNANLLASNLDDSMAKSSTGKKKSKKVTPKNINN